MKLIGNYFTSEGRLNISEQKLEDLVNKKLHSKADKQFCVLFNELVKSEQWTRLSKIISNYLKQITDKSIIESNISSKTIEHAIILLDKNNHLNSTILLCDYFEKHNQIIGLYAKSANYNELFSYLTRKKILTKQYVELSIQKWEQYNGPITTNTSIVEILKGINHVNPNLIPDLAHIKECIEKYEEAAILYKADNQIKKAAYCYDLAHKYEEAISLYKEINDKESVSIISEKIGDYQTALQNAVQPERKFNLLLKTEKLIEAKSFALGFPTPEKYIQLIKEKAAELLKKKVLEHDYISAIELYNLSEEVSQDRDKILEAGRNFYLKKQLESTSKELANECLKKRISLEEKTGNYEIAGNLAEEELMDIELAITLYEKANLYHKAIKLTSKNIETDNSLNVKAKLAELHSKGGNLLKSANLYENIGEFEQAFELYYKLANYEKAIECYLKAPNQEEQTLIDLYKTIGGFNKIIDILINKNTFSSLKEALQIAESRNDIVNVQVIQKKLEGFKTVSQTDLESEFEQALKKTMNKYSKIIGIDFGTSTSVCAIYNRELHKVEIISNENGNSYVDSFFAINTEGELFFGEKAKLLSLTKPEFVVSRVKRFLGENKTFTIGDKRFKTEEIIAHQLSNLKNITNGYLRNKVKETFSSSAIGKNIPVEIIDEFFQQKIFDEVKDVILTVPAYFNDSQKRSTKDAAEIAGLNVRRLLHEPTSAAVAFEHQKKFTGKIAVLDLGGGTFDISLLDIGEGVFNVEKIGGNTKLGGSDIDDLIFDYFQKQIKEKYGINLSDKNYSIEVSRLKDACEDLKINLSNQDEFTIEMPYFLNNPKHSFTLNRKQLEEICEPFFENYCKTIKDTIQSIKDPIRNFILVGNATKMPRITQLSTSTTNAKQLQGIDPGVVVAIGAAIDGAILASDIKDKLILDVVPFSLGIEVQEKENSNKQISRIIENNSIIPISKTSPYTTVRDNQDTVKVRIYQGESLFTERNHFLGEFELTGIPPVKAGVPKIEVTFEINADCILTVTAKDTGTNKSQSIKITGSVRLSYTEKQNLVNQFENKSNSQIAENLINTTKIEIERKLNEFANNQNYIKQTKSKLFTLIEEKLQNNPYNYKANAEQAKIISEIFLEKEQIFVDNQKHIDRFTSLVSNYNKIINLHFDYTDSKIIEKLNERQNSLSQFLKQFKELNQNYKNEVVYKTANWVKTLENIVPDVEKMTILQKANYLIATENIANAIALLESNFNNNCTDSKYIETLLICYKKAGDINKYKNAVSENKVILDNIIPDFNHLNNYLKSISNSVFLIEIHNEDGKIGNGSGFCISENLIVTNRHVVEGSSKIKIIGFNKVFSPTKIDMDTQNDIAILHVSESLKKLRIGVSEFIEPGEKVIAIGFPSAASNSFSENIYISHGVVNSIRKHEMSTDRVIFIDNKIGAGMSGGPIINDIGEIVGIVTFIQYHIRNNESGVTALENQPVALPIHLITEMIKEKTTQHAV
jgi:molecular chaperone DnaK